MIPWVGPTVATAILVATATAIWVVVAWYLDHETNGSDQNKAQLSTFGEETMNKELIDSLSNMLRAAFPLHPCYILLHLCYDMVLPIKSILYNQ